MSHIQGQCAHSIFISLLSVSLFLTGCGGGGGGSDSGTLPSAISDTTDAGAPLSTDSESRPVIDIVISDPIPDVIPLTGDGCFTTPELEATFIALVNQSRSQAQQCGDTEYAAALPLTWDERLEGAALKHSEDMADNLFFDHQGTDSSYVAERVTAENYTWRNVGENIAVGQSSMEQVMQDWMNSPPHCAAIMGVSYRNLGVSCADNNSLTYSRYWTMVLGRASN